MKFLAKYSLCIQGDSGVPLIRDQAVNGVSQPGESSKPASVLFSNQAAQIPLRFVFRMNRATFCGRIWDSTHLLSSSMSSPCLLSFMLSVGRLNAAMLCEVILDSPTQIKLIVGARLRLRAPGCRPRS